MGYLVDRVRKKHPRLSLILDIITRFGFYFGMIALFFYIRYQYEVLIAECPCLLYDPNNISFQNITTNITELIKSLNNSG